MGRRFTGSRLTGFAHAAWNAPAGLTLLIVSVMAVGQLPGALARVPLLGWTGAMLAGAIVWDRIAMRRRTRDATPAGGRGPVVVAASLIGLVAVVGLFWNRVPAVFFDTLCYHFAQPALWLVNGRIAAEAWSIHSWYPPGMSVLYGLAMVVSGETLANDVNLIAGLSLLAMSADLARRLWGGWAAPAAVAVLATLPITIFDLGIPAADLGHGAFCFGALACLLLASREPEEPWLRRAGYLAAGAVATKYLGWVAPVGLGSLWLFVTDRFRPRRVLEFVVPAFIAATPWLFADAFATGNPVAPIASSVIHTEGAAPGSDASFRADARGGRPGIDDVTSAARRLIVGDDADSRIYPTPTWGWSLVLAIPLGWWLRRGDPDVPLVLAVAAALFVGWFFTFRWERFLVACSAFLAVAAAGVLVPLMKKGLGLALPAAVLLLAVLGAWRAGLDVAAFTGGLPVATGAVTREAFVARAFPYVELAGQLDPGRDRVLFLGENRHFRFPIPHAAPTAFNVHPLAERLAAGDDPGTALAALGRLGFTHLLVDAARVRADAEHYPSLAVFRGRDELLRSTLDALGAPQASAGGAALYRLPNP